MDSQRTDRGGGPRGPSADREAFGARLKAALEARGWSQSDLARKADIGRDLVSSYVNARTLPSRANVDKLAEALSIHPNELLKPAEGQPDVTLHVVAGSGRGRLQLDMELPLDTAFKIMRLVEAAEGEAHPQITVD